MRQAYDYWQNQPDCYPRRDSEVAPDTLGPRPFGMRCVFALQFILRIGVRGDRPSSREKKAALVLHTPQPWSNSTPDTTRSFIRSRRPGSRLDRRSIASPTSTTTVIQSYTPDGCLRNLREGLPAHAYRLRFRVISQSWTLRAQSELPGVTLVGLPGSQVLRSWLC